MNKLLAAIQQISLAVDSAPAATETDARSLARELRNVFMEALPELGAHDTVAEMGPVIRRFRRHVEARGFDVSTEISHVYLALELLDRPLEREAHESTLLAMEALRAES